MASRPSPICSRIRREAHRGVVALWTLLMIPVLLVMFAVVVEGVHLWLARVELENALEAAALASVKEWAESGSAPGQDWTDGARIVGVDYAEANLINQTQVGIDKNLSPDTFDIATNPNENASCEGDVVFGAITEEDPYVFEADVAPSCNEGRVFIDAWKPDSGTGQGAPESGKPRLFGVFFDEGRPELSILSVSFSMPDCSNPNAPAAQQAHFDGSKAVLVSVADQDPDFLNRFNPGSQPKDVRGLDPTPVSVSPDNWVCPTSPPPWGTLAGDVCFTFSDPISAVANGFRTFTANFRPGAFTSTDDPNTTDFIRFGASIGGLNPPCFPGAQNDGDAIGQAGVFVTVVFYNSRTDETSTCTTRFVDDPIDKYSTAICRGSSALGHAVRTQATHTVPSLICSFLGINFGGPFTVSACTTAMYDCELQRPRLIRVEEENFICTP